MKINRITAGVAALVMGAVTPAFFMADGTNVVCAEKVYDVKLSAETVEIDINDIPENREVLVGINIDNNPGYMIMGFWIRKDSRLGLEEYQPFEFDNNKIAVSYGFYDSGNVLEANLIPVLNEGELFNENGVILKVKCKLPSDVKSGDYYELTPLFDFSGDPVMQNSGFYRANSFDAFFGRENFAEPVAGGIRITGQKAEPSQSPELSPSPSPTQEKKSTNQSSEGSSPSPSAGGSVSPGNNDSENKQETQAVTMTISETVSTSVSESTSESISVSETIVSVSETPVTSVSETEFTEETTTVSETTVTETDDREKDNSKNKILTAVLAFAAAVAGVCTYRIIHRNKKNKEN